MGIGGASTPSRRGIHNCKGTNAGMGRAIAIAGGTAAWPCSPSSADFSSGVEALALSQQSTQFGWACESGSGMAL